MKKTIGILMGGISSEREISFIEGRDVIEKIDIIKYDIKEIIIDSKEDIFNKVKDIDFAYIALLGAFGEDGHVQAILESMNIPYSGSNMLTSALCMNKKLTKIMLEKNNIKTPKWIEIRKIQDIDYTKLEEIGYPLVIKPSKGGSSIGVSLVNEKENIKSIVEKILKEDDSVLIEEYIKGDEYSTFMLNREVFPTINIKPNGEMFDYKAKYIAKDTKKTICNISQDLQNKIEDVCKKCWDIFECEVYVRMDYIVKDNDIYILELNTLPCTREGGLVSQSVMHKGMTKTKLIDKIIEYSLKIKR